MSTFHTSQINAINRFLLAMLLFLLPLIFFPFRDFDLPFGYERYKVFFLLLVSGLLLLWAIFRERKILKRLIWAIIGSVVLVIFWYSIFGFSWQTLLLGTTEKWHGLAFFVSLGAVFVSFCQISEEERLSLHKAIILSGVFVSIYAIIQALLIDFSAVKSGVTSWSSARVFSTLGNPNYLACYLLLLFPLLAEKKFREVVGYWMLFSLVLLLTGSLFGIGIAAGYGMYRLLRKYRPAWLPKALILIFFLCVAVFFLGQHFGITKMLSLESRFSLWQLWFLLEKMNPLALLVGHGPDAILQAISGKATLDPRYFQPGSRVDSFHNVVLDAIFFFGMPLMLAVSAWIVRIWKWLPAMNREGVVLFVLFFLFNIPISVHFVLLAFFLSGMIGEKQLDDEKWVW